MMKTKRKQCGICKSKNTYKVCSLPHIKCTVICRDCNAVWWDQWYTLKDWNKVLDKCVKSPEFFTV